MIHYINYKKLIDEDNFTVNISDISSTLFDQDPNPRANSASSLNNPADKTAEIIEYCPKIFTKLREDEMLSSKELEK